MPINGNFLTDLSSGIFGRLGELRNEQTARDEARRGEALKFLGGLAGSIEPESLPVLMRVMGDVGGFKGKIRNVWDALSGMPNRSVEDQIGTGMREALGLTMGPGAAKTARGKAATNLALDAFGGGPTSIPQTLDQAAGIDGRMIFRDPRKEELEEIKTRFQGQLANQQSQTAFKENLLLSRMKDLEDDRQRNRKDLEDYKRDNKATADVRERAWTLATQSGFLSPTPAHMSEAANQIGKEQGLNVDLLKARIGLAQDLGAKARMEVQALKTGGGLTPSQKLSEKRFTAQQEKELREMESDFTRAEATVKDLTPKILEMEKSLDDTAKKFGKTREEILSSDAFSITSPTGPIGKLVKDYRKMVGDKSTAEAELNTKHQQMEEFKRKYSSGSKQVTPPPKALPRAGLTTEKNIIRFKPVEGRNYEPGVTKITQRGRPYIVVGFDPDGTVLAKPIK